jgi:hypothetical protein
MNRRKFCQSLGLLPFALSGCAVIPDFYDKATYGVPKRIAIIDSPNMFSVDIDRDLNIVVVPGGRFPTIVVNSRADSAAYRRVVPILEPLCADFGPRMRKRMSEVFIRDGIQSSLIPFREPTGMGHSFIHSKINYPEVNELFFLDSKITLCLVKSGTNIFPCVSTYNRLLTPDSKLLWRKAVSVGPSIYDGNYMVATIDRRFNDIDSTLSAAQEVADLLLSNAPLIGEDIATSLIEVVTASSKVYYLDAMTEEGVLGKARSLCPNGYRVLGKGQKRNYSIDHVMTVSCD